MVTAYDYPSAIHVCRAGIDILLVGDSLGMVELGYETTQPVTVDDMLHHCKVRGVKGWLSLVSLRFARTIGPAERWRNSSIMPSLPGSRGEDTQILSHGGGLPAAVRRATTQQRAENT